MNHKSIERFYWNGSGDVAQAAAWRRLKPAPYTVWAVAGSAHASAGATSRQDRDKNDPEAK